MNNKNVSIIVPVYNAQSFLSKTIDSILNQTYQNIEVILINDGSTDKSGVICDQFQKQDPRIKVIHQQNSGVSASRNVGIVAAKGEFIQFVDADDFIDTNMTSRLVAKIETGADLVICSYKTEFFKNGVLFSSDQICPIEGIFDKKVFTENFGELFYKRFINPIWNKLYVTNNLKSKQIYFDESFSMGEDLLFNLEYIKTCESVFITKEVLYNYINSNVGSLTASVQKDLFKNQQILFSKVREFLSDHEVFNDVNKKYVETSFSDSVVRCFENLFHKKSNLSKKEKKTEIKVIIMDDKVRNSVVYFSDEDIQKRFLAKMIERGNVSCIYLFFTAKTFLRNHLKPIFILIKRVSKNESVQEQ